ncbi:DUF2523 family protein [Iodobacter sp. CM08]|uniref:DUF2523 family protein n=1 Tax=Iodobacter sp. CM08 TaxID=3085902 RepID=UPI002982718B|nr:DUF2523 family protein [Iodobacter sp. CM08]MDW5415653.1 DUF2523 family protein [Iodobacter sp. CM08]
MFGIVLSALNMALSFILRSIIVKFVIFFALFFVVTEFIQVLISSGLLPSANGVSSGLAGIPSSVWYFLDLFNVTAGIPIVLSAYVTRFIIRRIPVIG